MLQTTASLPPNYCQFAAGGAGGGGEDELPHTIDDGRRGYLLRWRYQGFTHRLYLRVTRGVTNRGAHMGDQALCEKRSRDIASPSFPVVESKDLLDQVVGGANSILGAGLADLDKLGPCDCRATPTVRAQIDRKSVERRGASTCRRPLRMFRALEQSCLPAVRRAEAPGCPCPHISTTSQENVGFRSRCIMIGLRRNPIIMHASMLYLPSPTDRHAQASIPPRQAAGSCRDGRAPLQGLPTVLERLRRYVQAAQHGEHDKAAAPQHCIQL